MEKNSAVPGVPDRKLKRVTFYRINAGVSGLWYSTKATSERFGYESRNATNIIKHPSKHSKARLHALELVESQIREDETSVEQGFANMSGKTVLVGAGSSIVVGT
jgi:hypothetical protein